MSQPLFFKCTNKIERKNLNLRTHLKLLNRRTISFSKRGLDRFGGNGGGSEGLDQVIPGHSEHQIV